MKVVLIYRQRRSGANSIEELFHTIAGELRSHVEVIEYEAGSRWHALFDAWRLWRLQANVYHLTGDIHYLVLFLPRSRTVLTVHDLNHLLYDLTGLKRWIFKWVWMSLPIRYANSVTAISDVTKTHIEKHLGICRTIHVISNCYSRVFRKIPKKFLGSKTRILQVGTKPNKNIPRLIDALRGIPCCLVIIGVLTQDLILKLNAAGIEYENLVNLRHEEVLQQYVIADMLCFVSLHEGFGLPIIEAQVVGRPVITSHISPMCDVAGGAACLVDPRDSESIRKGIIAVMNDQDYREALVEKGYINAASYSPSSVAKRYLRIYGECLLVFDQ